MEWWVVKVIMRTFTTINGRVGIHGKPGGFTIVELLLVVAIITLLAGTMGGIYVGTYKRMLVEKAAREVMLAAKYARVIAIEKQSHCKLILDETNSRFHLAFKDEDSRDDEDSATVITNQYSRPTEFGGDVRFEDIRITPMGRGDESPEEQSQIVFRPDGTADTAILQIGDGKNHYTVYIPAATGRARVQFGLAGELPVEIVDLDMAE